MEQHQHQQRARSLPNGNWWFATVADRGDENEMKWPPHQDRSFVRVKLFWTCQSVYRIKNDCTTVCLVSSLPIIEMNCVRMFLPSTFILNSTENVYLAGKKWFFNKSIQSLRFSYPSGPYLVLHLHSIYNWARLNDLYNSCWWLFCSSSIDLLPKALFCCNFCFCTSSRSLGRTGVCSSPLWMMMMMRRMWKFVKHFYKYHKVIKIIGSDDRRRICSLFVFDFYWQRMEDPIQGKGL